MKKPPAAPAPLLEDRPWHELAQDPHRAMLARMARWELPIGDVHQASSGGRAVQIGHAAGDVTVNHIGSQVNHITQAAKLRKPKPPGLLEHDADGAPTSWPELLRASVWGGL